MNLDKETTWWLILTLQDYMERKAEFTAARLVIRTAENPLFFLRTFGTGGADISAELAAKFMCEAEQEQNATIDAIIDELRKRTRT